MKRRTRLAVRSLPAVFLVQGLEEVWAMPGWAARHAGELPAFVVSFMPAERGVLVAALAVLFVLFLIGGLVPLPPAGKGDGAGSRTSGGTEDGRGRASGGRVIFVALLVASLGTNALGHLGQAALTGGYVPGLASGVLLCVPYAGWTLRGLMKDDLLTGRGTVGTVVASAVLQVPVLLGLVALLRRVMG